MKHGSLFSGIGGFDLAAEWMGWENVFHCEINDFGKKILKYYWPEAITYDDIKKTDFSIHRGQIDILTGGFPCQPYSTAGMRKGKDDDRHLWPEMLRAIWEIQPTWIVGENVRGFTNWNGGMVFDEVQSDLEAKGYEVLPFILPSASIGANNIRERVWFLAYSNSVGWEDVQSNLTGSGNKVCHLQRGGEEVKRRQEKASFLDTSGNSFLQFTKMYGKPPIFAMDERLPFELDGITVPKWIKKSCIAAGNAINPKVVYEIFKAIEKYESYRSKI